VVLLRVLLGYALACLIAITAIILGEFIGSGETIVWPDTWAGYREIFDFLMFGSGLVGAIMFIPSLFFFALAWGLRGPSLLTCVVFGGAGGILSLIVNSEFDDLGPAVGIALRIGVAGVLAGLVFWFIAV